MKIELIFDEFLKMLQNDRMRHALLHSHQSYSIDFVAFLQSFAVFLQSTIGASHFQFEPHALHFTKVFARRWIFLQRRTVDWVSERHDSLEWIFQPSPTLDWSHWPVRDTSYIYSWWIDQPYPKIELRPSMMLPFENLQRAFRRERFLPIIHWWLALLWKFSPWTCTVRLRLVYHKSLDQYSRKLWCCHPDNRSVEQGNTVARED